MERRPSHWPFREELLHKVVDTLISGSVADVCRFVTWGVHGDLCERLLLLKNKFCHGALRSRRPYGLLGTGEEWVVSVLLYVHRSHQAS